MHAGGYIYWIPRTISETRQSIQICLTHREQCEDDLRLIWELIVPLFDRCTCSCYFNKNSEIFPALSICTIFISWKFLGDFSIFFLQFTRISLYRYIISNIDIFIILYTFEKILITVDFESSKCLKIYTMFQHVVPGLISFVSCFACVYRYFIFSWVRISILSSSSTKSWFKTHCYEIESLKLSIIYINKKNHNPRSNPYPILNYSILKYTNVVYQ